MLVISHAIMLSLSFASDEMSYQVVCKHKSDGQDIIYCKIKVYINVLLTLSTRNILGLQL